MNRRAFVPEIMGKRLQLLKEVAPLLSKVASLTRVPPSAAVPNISSYENVRESLPGRWGWNTDGGTCKGSAISRKRSPPFIREGVGALDVHYVPVTWTYRQRIRDFAMQRRLPAVYWHRTFVLDGGLMAYAEGERDVPRRLAIYVDKILRGAKPADLPVEQPSKFELIINLKTAKALNLTIPPSLLLRADQVIEINGPAILPSEHKHYRQLPACRQRTDIENGACRRSRVEYRG